MVGKSQQLNCKGSINLCGNLQYWYYIKHLVKQVPTGSYSNVLNSEKQEIGYKKDPVSHLVLSADMFFFSLAVHWAMRH